MLYPWLFRLTSQVSTGDLRTVYHSIRDLIEWQQFEYTVAIGNQELSVAHRVNRPLFAALIGRVTGTALAKLYNELERSRRQDFPSACSCTISRVMGLPCGHRIADYVRTDTPIPLSDIDQHWYFEPTEVEDQDPAPALLDPLPIPSRSSKRSTTLTRRLPSAWEVELEAAERRGAQAPALQQRQATRQTKRKAAGTSADHVHSELHWSLF